MADTEGKKILQGLWADTGDRQNPELAGLVRLVGFPASYSATDGDTPERAVVNQLFREMNGAASDCMRYGGLLPYDADINYFLNARCFVGLDEYVATVANGPASTVVGPTDVGQTTWQRVTGELNSPAAPTGLRGDALDSGELFWTWQCPLDGGSAITSFDFQWRRTGTSAWTNVSLTIPVHTLTGLVNGVSIQVRVRATNARGTGAWSNIGTAIPQADLPSGGSQLALRATPGNALVDLDWLEPDSGGAAITGYQVQFRLSNQGFSSSRQITSTSLSATVTSLANGSQYFFRVRAINSVGNGPYSNETSATPIAPDPVVVPPSDTAPSAPGQPSAESDAELKVDWVWSWPADDGGQPVQSMEFQWRYVGSGWSGNIINAGTTTAASHFVANRTRGIEARVRARNVVGTGAWSNIGSLAANDISEGDMPTGSITPFAGSSIPTGWLACDGGESSRTTEADLFAVIGTIWGAGNGSSTFNRPDFRGRAAVGSGGADDSQISNVVGRVGGSREANLSEDQIPSHNHPVGSLGTSSGGSHSHGSGGLATAAAGAHSHGKGSLVANDAGAHGHSLTGRTDESGTHTHGINGGTSSSASGAVNAFVRGTNQSHNATGATRDGGNHTHDVTGNTSVADDHNHDISGDTDSVAAHSHNVTGSTGTAGSHSHNITGSTGSRGGGQAHDNMQPSAIVNFIIKR